MSSKPTPGVAAVEFCVPSNKYHVEVGAYPFGKSICEIEGTSPEDRANAALIAEAFTVHDETGLTPQQLCEVLGDTREDHQRAIAAVQQLREQRDQLLAVVKATRALVTEAAMNGFNHKLGDNWPDKLFENQARLSAAIANVEAAS